MQTYLCTSFALATAIPRPASGGISVPQLIPPRLSSHCPSSADWPAGLNYISRLGQRLKCLGDGDGLR
jgi:hypothetical protein